MEVGSFVLVKFSIFQVWLLTSRSLPVQLEEEMYSNTNLPAEINPNDLTSQAC